MILLIIELLSILTTLTLAVLWILCPAQNLEPYTVLSGLVIVAVEWARRRAKHNATKAPSEARPSQGGPGGSAIVHGAGVAIGGAGGAAGAPGGGAGGAGGDAEVHGDGIAMGGEGGEAGQADRGGRGGRSPFEVLGVSNRQLPDGRWLWEFGRGGDGGSPGTSQGSSPEQSRRGSSSE